MLQNITNINLKNNKDGCLLSGLPSGFLTFDVLMTVSFSAPLSNVTSSFNLHYFLFFSLLTLPERILPKNLNKIAGLNRFISEIPKGSTGRIKRHTRVSFFLFCFSLIHWKILPSHNVYCLGLQGYFYKIYHFSQIPE